MISFKRLKTNLAGFYRYVVAAAAGMLMVASCADETAINDIPVSGKEGYITLILTNSELRSRDPEDGITTSNENYLQRALICLMPTTASGDDNVPAFMQTVTLPTNTQRTGTVQLKLTRSLVNTLFPGNTTTASAYVIANLPASVTYTDTEGRTQTANYSDAALQGKTLGELRKLIITSNPTTQDFSDRRRQTSFVMDGTSSEIRLELNPTDIAKSTVTGNVPLTRSASKITLSVKVSDNVTDDAGRVWTPQYGTMTVYLSNGVKTSAVESSTAPEVGDRYYNTSANAINEYARGRSFAEQQDKDYPYVQANPFYTYPNNWTDSEETMTYMTLSLQWRSDANYRVCYYMVPVVKGVNYIARNTSYNVNINLGILGSTNPDNPFTIDASYKAVDWGKEEIGLNIDDFRYLVVDRTDYTLNNEASISIPFYSSHDTEIVYQDDALNYYLFNATADGIEREMTITNSQRNRSTTSLLGDSVTHIYSDWIDNSVGNAGTRTLHFNHPLYQWQGREWSQAGGVGNVISFGPYSDETAALASLNSIGAYSLPTPLTAAFSRYRMKITIRHKDAPQYSQTIYITQYPGMYIEADWNPANATTGGLGANIYINNSLITGLSSTNHTAWNGISTNWTEGNANPNMYVINVTQLGVGSNYVIGDPRMTVCVNNLETRTDSGSNTSFPALSIPQSDEGEAGDWCNLSTALYKNNNDNRTQRRLAFYYPTIENYEDSLRIAYKFRIASSYGKCPATYTRDNARKRMATYQEMGFPAGRWRLPTYGELKYIVSLSEQGKIPVLFNNGSSYWTAQGIYTIEKSGVLTPKDHENNQQRAFVRGVYDEWYWEKYTNYAITPTGTNYTYTLGDVPRSVAPADQ